MTKGLRTDDYDFYLPESQIAQTPEMKRDHSKLMIVNRETGEIEDKHFYDILDELHSGDLLVVNNTKVLPARIYGHKRETGGKVEILLLKNLGNNRWECLVKPGRKARPGDILEFGDELEGKVLEIIEDGKRIIEFKYEGIFEEILDRLGEMPLPPYIHEKLKDSNRYQTVYAEIEGSAAAPTAGLHFTEELLEAIKEKGVDIAEVTLNIGLGTFRPVKVDDISEHVMHTEAYSIPKETVEKIKKTKANNGRVIAVGTTSVRALESSYEKNGEVTEETRDTDIFIYPGKKINVVDALITNFHLPKSTLLMLVSAFYNREKILESYHHAVDNNYRFFSFGDAMFIK